MICGGPPRAGLRAFDLVVPTRLVSRRCSVGKIAGALRASLSGTTTILPTLRSLPTLARGWRCTAPAPRRSTR